MKKRGEAPVSKTASTAALVLLIFFFLLGYLVLLPSEERAELLDYELEGEERENGLEEDVESILIKSPGYLGPYSADKEEKEFGSIDLYSGLEQESVGLANSLYVSRNIFSNNDQTLNFKLINIDNLQDLGLFFNVVDSKGDLIVKLNDNVVYQGEGLSFEMPISLPLNLLRYNNKLTLMTNSPGINIFGSNYYELKDINLVKTEKYDNKEEEVLFSIDKDKLSANADLEFYINCLKVGKQQGILKVSLNEKNIFTQRIVCDAGKREIKIRKEYFKDGENELKFEIDRGSYRIGDLTLSYNVRAGENPIYYFSIDDEDLYKEFELNLLFGRGDLKRAMFIINGEEISMVSEENEWVKDISGYVKEGENYIKLIPRNEFEITHLEIVLIE